MKARIQRHFVLFVMLEALHSVMMFVDAQNNTSMTTDDGDCASEIAALNSDPTIQQALTDLEGNISAAIQDDFYQFCSILGRECTVNLTDYYSKSLPTACIDAGGQLATQTASLECNGKVLGIPIPGGVRVKFVDIPTCVGPSCDLKNLPTVVEDATNSALDQVEQLVENGLDDGNCTAAIVGSSGSARQTLSGVFCATGILFVLSML